MIISQMPPKDIFCIGRRFLGDMQKMHMRLFHLSASLAVITGGAGRDQIRPDMLPTHVARNDMIDRQVALALAAILAGIIVAPEKFAARELDTRTWPMDLRFQPNDRWTREQFCNRADVPASVCDHTGLPCKD